MQLTRDGVPVKRDGVPDSRDGVPVLVFQQKILDKIILSPVK
jgi:hypothetical protein